MPAHARNVTRDPSPRGPALSSPPLPEAVRALAERLGAAGADPAALPAYAWDLVGLPARSRDVRASVPAEVEIFYAAKANPDAGVLATLAGPNGALDGVEVAPEDLTDPRYGVYAAARAGSSSRENNACTN